MLKPLNTYLFGNERIATATKGRSKYGHTFGGPHDRNGVSREDCNGLLLHLLHRLDLEDSAIPIRIPGIRWLPLYYCFDFRANELGYRLLSDGLLVTYFPKDDPNVSQEESWPDENYPLEFPQSTIKVTSYTYAPTNIDDALAWGGIFGIGKLSKADQAAAKKRIFAFFEGLGFEVPKSQKEYHKAVATSPFFQGKPKNVCLNPQCPNHKKPGRLSTIAMMPPEPVKGVRTFGRWGEAELIFEMCPKCTTIRVSNQCT